MPPPLPDEDWYIFELDPTYLSKTPPGTPITGQSKPLFTDFSDVDLPNVADKPIFKCKLFIVRHEKVSYRQLGCDFLAVVTDEDL